MAHASTPGPKRLEDCSKNDPEETSADQTKQPVVIDSTVVNGSDLNERLRSQEKVLAVLENQLKKFELEKNKLEDRLNEEKVKLKTSAEQIADFRAELIKIKGEKKSMRSKLQAIESENEKLKEDQVSLKEENENLQKALKQKKELLISEHSKIDIIENEKENLQYKVRETLAELETFKSKADEENNVKKEYSCMLCNERLESIELKNHVKDKDCQTIDLIENFDEYLCYYCEVKIKTKDDLETHRNVCCENIKTNCQQSETFSQPLPSFHPTFHPDYPPPFAIPTDAPCYTCSERFRNKTDLRSHYSRNHPELILFWCDVCLTNFGSERGLKSHMRNNHKIYS